MRRVFWMTIRGTFLRRRSVLMGGLIALPILAAGFIRLSGRPGGSMLPLLSVGMIHGVITLISLIYGSSLMGDEISSGTWIYLATRPISRSKLIIGKFLGYAAVILSIVAVTITSICLLIWPGWEGYLRYLASFALGGLAYGGVGLFLGVQTRRPILIGLLLIGWEKIASQVPGALRRLTIMDYMLSIFPSTRGVRFILKGRLSPYHAAAILALIAILFIWRSIARLKGKEISTFSP